MDEARKTFKVSGAAARNSLIGNTFDDSRQVISSCAVENAIKTIK